jgi:hypothetical protein
MQLTEAEKKVIERTRIISNRWPKARWIALPLVAAVVVMAFVYYLMYPPIIGYISAGFSGYLAIIQLIRMCQWWNGVPKDKLLLKLADEHDKTAG